MATIQEQLREGRTIKKGNLTVEEAPTEMELKAADVIDALVEALEAFAIRVPLVAREQPSNTLVARAGIELELFLNADAALSRARGDIPAES